MPEYWTTMGQHKQNQEIAKWQQRKHDADDAIAKRTVPRVPVNPSGMVAAIIAPSPINCPASDGQAASMSSLVDKSEDDVTQTPSSDSDVDTNYDSDDKDDI